MNQLDPKQVSRVKQVSSKIHARIVHDHAANEVSFKLSSDDPEAAKLIPKILKQFTDLFAGQMKTFFDISGEIVDKNKAK